MPSGEVIILFVVPAVVCEPPTTNKLSVGDQSPKEYSDVLRVSGMCTQYIVLSKKSRL